MVSQLLQVGVLLGTLFLASVCIGDERLCRIWILLTNKTTGGGGGGGNIDNLKKQKTKILPELSPTVWCRPICSLAFATWIWYTALKCIISVVFYDSLRYFMVYFSCYFLLAILVAIRWKGYGYHNGKQFEGITINVREPHKKFVNMNYEFNPNDLGYCVWLQLFFCQFSSLLVPFELGIHSAMGNDIQRIIEHTSASSNQDTTDGNNDTNKQVVVTNCEGMIAQELNHGKCQLLYSRSAERTINYPCGYRRFWKVFMNSIPLGLSQAFVCYFESSFIVLNGFISEYPYVFQHMFPSNTIWMWSWHFLEETEHCWDSVQDMMEKCDVLSRFIIWSLGWFLLSLQMWPLALIEGIVYGYKAILFPPADKSRLQIILWTVGMWFVWVPNFLFVCQACSFLHIICGMRPSDEAYFTTRDNMYNNIYKPHEKLFKITHIQSPYQHLMKRRSTRISTSSSRMRMSSIRMSLTKRTSSLFSSFGSRRSSLFGGGGGQQQRLSSIVTKGSHDSDDVDPMRQDEGRHASGRMSSTSSLRFGGNRCTSSSLLSPRISIVSEKAMRRRSSSRRMSQRSSHIRRSAATGNRTSSLLASSFLFSSTSIDEVDGGDEIYKDDSREDDVNGNGDGDDESEETVFLTPRQVQSIRQLSTSRASLYAETFRELQDAGMSIEEINDAGFGYDETAIVSTTSGDGTGGGSDGKDNNESEEENAPNISNRRSSSARRSYARSIYNTSFAASLTDLSMTRDELQELDELMQFHEEEEEEDDEGADGEEEGEQTNTSDEDYVMIKEGEDENENEGCSSSNVDETKKDQ